ncbi:Hypothetical predicted protein [Paramuricea clavata]|uniref:Uncharacterized protein n=1 Tax=Paramuricea clavata TaxID=317549 RepID=A0A7D9D6Q7_PARCT|nr:Hypothetical predicted protein [Paramuricea clavata]
MATSTKTHYFETNAAEIRVVELLKKMIENGKLTYYRYTSITSTPFYDQRRESGEKKTIVRRGLKLCGVLQFKDRVSPSAARRLFAVKTIFLSALVTVRRPIVLVLMRLWVLCEYYDTHYSEIRCSNTPIGFGGKKTENEARYMKPYIMALSEYTQCKKDDFCYAHLTGARKICKYKMMLEKKLVKKQV